MLPIILKLPVSTHIIHAIVSPYTTITRINVPFYTKYQNQSKLSYNWFYRSPAFVEMRLTTSIHFWQFIRLKTRLWNEKKITCFTMNTMVNLLVAKGDWKHVVNGCCCPVNNWQPNKTYNYGKHDGILLSWPIMRLEMRYNI